MSGELNLVKLCVGVEKVSELAEWREMRAMNARAMGMDYVPHHITACGLAVKRNCLMGVLYIGFSKA